MAKKNAFPENERLTGLMPDERDARIRETEADRLAITEEIERVMREYARESGDKNLARRMAKVGEAPNDFSDRL